MKLSYARDPLGKRRPIRAQRFNLASGARMLYLADDPSTCVEEAKVVFGYPASAMAILPVHFDLKAVVNLTLPPVQELLETNLAELTFNFRSTPERPTATQLLGEAVAAAGCLDGLFYPSPARPGHIDLVVVEKALANLGSRLTVEDPPTGIN